MGIERFQARGIREGGIRDNDINPTGQSALFDFGKNVLIVRPLKKEFSGLPADKEFARRCEAVRWHQEKLPNYTLKTNLVLLEGREETEDGEKSTKILGRLNPKLENVQPISEIPAREVVSSSDLCRALSRINLAYFKGFLTSGSGFDTSPRGKQDNSLPPGISWLVNQMLPSNVMIGTNEFGDKKIFCDPDWFLSNSDIKTGSLFWDIRLKTRLTVSAIFCLIKGIFFSSLYLGHRLRRTSQILV